MKIMSLMRNKLSLPCLIRGHASSERGFSFIELLVSMAITAIISVALYGIYNSFYKTVNIQDQVQESLQNARAGLSFMEREFINAGLASGQAEALTEATAASIEFVYRDPETDGALSVTAGLRIRVKYGIETLSGVQYLYRAYAVCADPTCSAALGSNEPIISYVSNLNITYFDSDGAFITPSTQALRETVRFATITLQTTTRDLLPGMTVPKIFTIKTHLRLRNLGLGTTASDNIAPAFPTVVNVRDPGDCSSLMVKWNKSSSGDVAGYKIYYGTVSGTYDGVVDVPINNLSGSTYSCTESSGNYECTITPNLPAFSYSPSDGSGDIKYYIIVKAYDNSFNNSLASSEVDNNPTTSNSDFGVSVQDTTINPVKPDAVVNFFGSDGASDNEVSFTWDAYDTTSNPSVTGFRIYRSTTDMSTYPIINDESSIFWLAGEPDAGRPLGDVAVSDTSFTDNSSGLLGCQLYYYAIAPVNCDSTLISDADAAENGDYTKYIASDYGLTDGDGSTGPASDTPAGADTSPAETTAPSAPIFDIRAGWKRVALSLEQPSDSDLARSCVYVNEGSDYPELQTDTAIYPLLNGCLRINTSLSPDAQLIPDSGGIFTTAELSPGATTSFWHDSLVSESPSVPELSEDGTFSYRDVAIDICGNASGISEAQAVTVLCGEDPKISDFTVNNTDHPKPPIVTLPDVESCASSSRLTWTQVPSDTAIPSSPTNPYDLAGYRIARSTTSDFSADNVMLTGGAPFWGKEYGDADDSDPLADGLAYYYKIITTDCVYEATDPSDATVMSDTLANTLHSVDLPVVYPGRIFRDEKCVGSSNCTRGLHREVLVGVDIDNAAGNGYNTSTPQDSFYHDKVTLFFENTSGFTMTIQKVSIGWVNPDVYLSKVTIGGGRGGLGEISTDIDTNDTQDIVDFDPQIRGVVSKGIADVEIPGEARYVPIELTFTDSAGDPVDMRNDMIKIKLEIENDSTSTKSCVSNLTISEELESITVPFGPSITATRQDKPSLPTFSYPIPGPAGINTVPSGGDADLIIAGNFAVTVYSSIRSNTTNAASAVGAKIALVETPELYYNATARTVIEAPTSGYTAVSMTDTGGGNYTGEIPSNDGLRIWYYILALDLDGNFDRDPEIDSGAYSYDQDLYVFDVCDLTTDEPTGFSALMVNDDDVDLVWTAPSLYTDTSTIDTGLDPLVYVIYRGGTELATVSDPTVTYTDVLPAGGSGGIFEYSVSVKNSCSPTPNESLRSITASSCVGDYKGAVMTVDTTSIIIGESFTVSITDCIALGWPNDVFTNILNENGTLFTDFSIESTWTEKIEPIGVTETANGSGQFSVTIGTTDDVGVAATDTLIHSLETGSGDITVIYDPPYVNPAAFPPIIVLNSPISIDVNPVPPDPCVSTPSAPTGLTGDNSLNHQYITDLTWNAVTTNDDSTAIADLAGYNIYEKVCNKNKPDCTGADIDTDWYPKDSVGPDKTTIVKYVAHAGGTNQKEYYYRVTAFDTCATPNESSYSSEWFDTD